MRTLYIDCSMGAAGDMLTAAALELIPDPGAFIEKMNAIGIPGVHFEAVPASKCGVSGAPWARSAALFPAWTFRRK